MLIKMYNIFCLIATSVFAIGTLGWMVYIVYDRPEILISVACLFGFFAAFAIVANGLEQIDKLFNRDQEDV